MRKTSQNGGCLLATCRDVDSHPSPVVLAKERAPLLNQILTFDQGGPRSVTKVARMDMICETVVAKRVERRAVLSGMICEAVVAKRVGRRAVLAEEEVHGIRVVDA